MKTKTIYVRVPVSKKALRRIDSLARKHRVSRNEVCVTVMEIEVARLMNEEIAKVASNTPN